MSRHNSRRLQGRRPNRAAFMPLRSRSSRMEATPRFELGIKALQASALPLGYVAVWWGSGSPSCQKADHVGPVARPWADLRRYRGADDGTRTRDPNLGKVVLYQLSHVRAQGVDYHGLSKRRNRVLVLRMRVSRATCPTQVGSSGSVPDCYNSRRCSGSHGRLAQGESTSLTRKGSEVQIL